MLKYIDSGEGGCQLQHQTQIVARQLGRISASVEGIVKLVRTGRVRVPFEALPCNANYSW